MSRDENEKPLIQTEARSSRLPEELKNPVVLGAFIHKLAEERKATNKMFNRILARLEKMNELEAKVKELETRLEAEAKLETRTKKQVFGAYAEATPEAKATPEPVSELVPKETWIALLPEVDEKILRFAAKRGKCFAEDVQHFLDYRGRNAASSRLNRLAEKGFLKKIRVGRKIAFLPTPSTTAFASSSAASVSQSGEPSCRRRTCKRARNERSGRKHHTSMSFVERHGTSFTHRTTSTS